MQPINICLNEKYRLANTENVNLSMMDSIPNFSAGNLHISFLNKMEKQQSIETLIRLIKKLKINGIIVFSLLNFDNLIVNYQNGDFLQDDIVSEIKDIRCLISNYEVVNMFQNNVEVTIDTIAYDKIYTTYTIRRTSIV